MRVQRLAPIVIVLLLGASCNVGFARRGSVPDVTPEPVETATVGKDLEELLRDGDGEEATEAGAKDKGTLVLLLVDQNGEHPDGIPVRIAGRANIERLTDDRGAVEVDLPPGVYSFVVPAECTDDVQVLAGNSGRFSIHLGKKVGGRTDIRWQRRNAPSRPVFASVQPYWPLDELIRVRFDLVDRCRNAPAKGKSFAAWRIRTADNLELVRVPHRSSDGDGHAWVEVRCLKEGPTAIELYDPENPDDRFDLVENENSGQPPSCGVPYPYGD